MDRGIEAQYYDKTMETRLKYLEDYRADRDKRLFKMVVGT